MEKEVFDPAKTVCIKCNLKHSRSVWAKPRFLNQDTIQRLNLNLFQNEGYVCNSFYMTIQDQIKLLSIPTHPEEVCSSLNLFAFFYSVVRCFS